MSPWQGNERTVEEQLTSLSEPHLAAFNALKERHEKDISERMATNKPYLFHKDYAILRFIRTSTDNFNVDAAFSTMQR
jgi:hypothetical protein